MEGKWLYFPNGQLTRSDRIWHVKVFPDLSPSKEHIYVEVFEECGLVFEGLLDDNVATGAPGAAEMIASRDGGLLPWPFP